MQKTSLKRSVLECIAAAGVVGLTFTIPAIFLGLTAIGYAAKIAKGEKYKGTTFSRQRKNYTYRVIAQLKKEGLIPKLATAATLIGAETCVLLPVDHIFQVIVNKL